MAEWQKAIPKARDELQSRALVWVLGPFLIIVGGYVVVTGEAVLRFRASLMVALALCLTFAVLVWALRAATLPASALGSLIALLVTEGTRGAARLPLRSGLLPLMTLFALTFAATRAGGISKKKMGLAEGRRGRTSAQVLANLGVAAIAIAGENLGCLHWVPIGPGEYAACLAGGTAFLAALCEATADTVSSEIGQVFGGTPVLLTTLRRVAPGTDGAVSLCGTTAGIFAAAAVAGAGMWSINLPARYVAAAFLGGVAGLFFDSLLGATLERRGWLGNDLVNFASTAFAAGVALSVLVVMR